MLSYIQRFIFMILCNSYIQRKLQSIYIQSRNRLCISVVSNTKLEGLLLASIAILSEKIHFLHFMILSARFCANVSVGKIRSGFPVENMHVSLSISGILSLFCLIDIILSLSIRDKLAKRRFSLSLWDTFLLPARDP